jgi:hypothetical protein
MDTMTQLQPIFQSLVQSLQNWVCWMICKAQCQLEGRKVWNVHESGGRAHLLWLIIRGESNEAKNYKLRLYRSELRSNLYDRPLSWGSIKHKRDAKESITCD